MNECNPSDTDHNKHNCDKHATCTNNFGSFACKCNDGWNGDGETCKNIGVFIDFESSTHKSASLDRGVFIHS